MRCRSRGMPAISTSAMDDIYIYIYIYIAPGAPPSCVFSCCCSMHRWMSRHRLAASVFVFCLGCPGRDLQRLAVRPHFLVMHVCAHSLLDFRFTVPMARRCWALLARTHPCGLVHVFLDLVAALPRCCRKCMCVGARPPYLVPCPLLCVVTGPL